MILQEQHIQSHCVKYQLKSIEIQLECCQSHFCVWGYDTTLNLRYKPRLQCQCTLRTSSESSVIADSSSSSSWSISVGTCCDSEGWRAPDSNLDGYNRQTVPQYWWYLLTAETYQVLPSDISFSGIAGISSTSIGWVSSWSTDDLGWRKGSWPPECFRLVFMKLGSF